MSVAVLPEPPTLQAVSEFDPPWVKYATEETTVISFGKFRLDKALAHSVMVSGVPEDIVHASTVPENALVTSAVDPSMAMPVALRMFTLLVAQDPRVEPDTVQDVTEFVFDS